MSWVACLVCTEVQDRGWPFTSTVHQGNYCLKELHKRTQLDILPSCPRQSHAYPFRWTSVLSLFAKMWIFCHHLFTKLKLFNSWMTFFLLSLNNFLVVLLHIIKVKLVLSNSIMTEKITSVHVVGALKCSEAIWDHITKHSTLYSLHFFTNQIW